MAPSDESASSNCGDGSFTWTPESVSFIQTESGVPARGFVRSDVQAVNALLVRHVLGPSPRHPGKYANSFDRIGEVLLNHVVPFIEPGSTRVEVDSTRVETSETSDSRNVARSDVRNVARNVAGNVAGHVAEEHSTHVANFYPTHVITRDASHDHIHVTTRDHSRDNIHVTTRDPIHVTGSAPVTRPVSDFNSDSSSNSAPDRLPSRAQVQAAVDEVKRASAALRFRSRSHVWTSHHDSIDAVCVVVQSRLDQAVYDLVGAVLPNGVALRRLFELVRCAVRDWDAAVDRHVVATLQTPTRAETEDDPSIGPATTTAGEIICVVAEMIWQLVRAVRLDCTFAATAMLEDTDGSYARSRPDADPSRAGFAHISWLDIGAVINTLDLSYLDLNPNSSDPLETIFPSNVDVGDGNESDYDKHPDRYLHLEHPMEPVTILRAAIGSLLIITRVAETIRLSVLKSIRAEVVDQFAGPQPRDPSLPNPWPRRYCCEAGTCSGDDTDDDPDADEADDCDCECETSHSDDDGDDCCDDGGDCESSPESDRMTFPLRRAVRQQPVANTLDHLPDQPGDAVRPPPSDAGTDFTDVTDSDERHAWALYNSLRRLHANSGLRDLETAARMVKQ